MFIGWADGGWSHGVLVVGLGIDFLGSRVAFEFASLCCPHQRRRNPGLFHLPRRPLENRRCRHTITGRKSSVNQSFTARPRISLHQQSQFPTPRRIIIGTLTTGVQYNHTAQQWLIKDSQLTVPLLWLIAEQPRVNLASPAKGSMTG